MKTIFWNVDTQYDFMRNDESFQGALAVPNARSIEPNLEKLTAMAAEHGLQVVNTADWHTARSGEFSESPDYMLTFPPHCLAGTPGAQYIPATKPEHPLVIDWRQNDYNPESVNNTRNIIIYKDAFDVFAGNPHTNSILQTLNPDRVVVYGVASDVCVAYAVAGLLERGVEVIIPQDAIKELPNAAMPELLRRWANVQAIITDTKNIEQYLRR